MRYRLLWQRRQAREISDPPSDPASDPVEGVEQRERHELVQRGLNDLDADDALLILLHDLQEFRYEEMAAMLEIPLGTVKSRLHRARQALKNKLAPHFSRKKWQ